MIPDPAVVSFGWALPAAAGAIVVGSEVKDRLRKTRDERSIERHQRRMQAVERAIDTPGLGLR